MADNSTANPGTGGDTFRTQDRTGVKTPTVILDFGGDGAESLVAAGNPLPVTLEGAVPSHAVTNAGTFATQVTSIAAGNNNIGDVDIASSVLPTGAATEATLATRLTESDFDSKVGSLTETAPATDTASSGLNGRLQRIAERLTTFMVRLPSALVSGRLDVNIGAAPATVTIAAIPAGTNNIGDVDVLSLPALPAGTNLIGNVGHGKTIKTVSGSLTADTDVIAAVATKRLKIFAYSLTSVGVNANTVIFKSNGTAGTELWRLLMQSSTAIASGANLATSAPSFLFATVAGEKLTIDVSQADAIHYSVSYFDDDTT